MSAVRESKGRAAYLDFLRVLAAFLVIVNHTNSHVFQASSPAHGTWYASVLWYYLSKMAVPLFVMISGACLLGKTDGYPKVAKRFVRVLLALLLAAYGYFLYDAWVRYGLWPRAARLDVFLEMVWRGRITDGFWYLSFYLGLMLTLPLWQRMAAGMQKRDYHYLLLLTLGLGAAWPLAAHYAPALALPQYANLSLPGVYVGVFFAGQYLRRFAKPGGARAPLAGVALALSLAVSLWLTRLEFDRVGAGESYWFMDDRSAPSAPTVVGALAIFFLAKAYFTGRREQSGPVLRELGGCAFAVYLAQDLLIAQTKRRLFLPLANALPAMLAVLIWEAAVFGGALALALAVRRIPLARRIF